MFLQHKMSYWQDLWHYQNLKNWVF